MNVKISELTKENNELRKQRNNIIGKPDPLMAMDETEKKDTIKFVNYYKLIYIIKINKTNII